MSDGKEHNTGAATTTSAASATAASGGGNGLGKLASQVGAMFARDYYAALIRGDMFAWYGEDSLFVHQGNQPPQHSSNSSYLILN
jgi:hypothetical protein